MNRKLLVIVGIVIMMFAGYKIGAGLFQYQKTDKLYQDVIDDYISENLAAPENDGVAEDADQSGNAKSIQVDFAGLQEINPEICGWLYFEEGEISYPILYSGDNEKYLHRDYKGDYLAAGSLFLDGRNSNDFQDAYSIIYGHNMKNLSMFGKLKYYLQDEDYYKTHQYFQIITQDGVRRYKIYAYKEVDVNDSIYEVIKSDGEASAKIVTLSTCTKGDGRLVVCGIQE